MQNIHHLYKYKHKSRALLPLVTPVRRRERAVLFAVMPIRLENMVTANIENNSSQPDLKDNLEWLSHGLKETLKLHHCGQTRTEFGHNVMSTMTATTPTSNMNDDVSPSNNNNNNNNTRYTSRHFTNNSMSQTLLEMDSIAHHNPTTTQQLHCSPNKRRTPNISEFMSSVVQGRHVSKTKTANSTQHHHHIKWVSQNNRVNKSRNVRRRRRKPHNIYIEDVRLGIQGKNTDYYPHQKYLSTQTLIQEAVKRLCALHNNNSNIINPNSTTTNTPGGVDMTTNGSNIINNNNNNGIVHQQHSGTTFCNINNISSTGNSQHHMGLAGVV